MQHVAARQVQMSSTEISYDMQMLMNLPGWHPVEICRCWGGVARKRRRPMVSVDFFGPPGHKEPDARLWKQPSGFHSAPHQGYSVEFKERLGHPKIIYAC